MSTKKKIIIILGILIVIGILVFVAIKNVMAKKGNEDQSGIPKDAINVQTEKAHVERIVSSVKAEGEIKFSESSFIYASVTAEVRNVVPKEGDIVEAGQILVEYNKDALDELKNNLSSAQLDLKSAKVDLENSQLPVDESEIKQAEASISTAEQNIKEYESKLEQIKITIDKIKLDSEKAKKDYDNAQIMYTEGVISKEDFDKYKNTYDDKEKELKTSESQYQGELTSKQSAEESLKIEKEKYDLIVTKKSQPSAQKAIESKKVLVQQAQLKIDQYQDKINKFKLNETAPISGTVVKVDVKEGEKPAEGKSLIEIADINDMIISLNVPEYDMADVKLNQEVLIKGDAIKNKFNGTISKIYPIAEKKVLSGSEKTVVTIEVTPKTTNSLKSGYSVEGEIITSISENAVVIPIMSYITEEEDKAFVYIVKDDYSLEKRSIVLKAYANLYVEVEGVKEGEIIVSSPNDMMQEGMFVRPIPKEEETQTSTQTENGSENTETTSEDVGE